MMHIQEKAKIKYVISQKKGMVLIFTLLMIAVLTTLTVSFSAKINQEVSLLQNSVDSLKASALAKGGVNYGIFILKSDEDPEADYLDEEWAQEYELIFGDDIVRINIEDECSKINLNYLAEGEEEETAPRIEQMLELCDNIGLEYSIIPAIIDWVDSDDEVTTLLSITVGENKGAENDYYSELSLPYPCKNAPLLTLDEVLMIKDIDEKNYYGEKGLKNFTTIHTDGRININTANKEVLKSTLQASLSSTDEDSEVEDIEPEIIDDAIIDDIMNLRVENPFYELLMLEDFFSSETVSQISNSGFFTVKSDFFFITSKAKVGRVEKKITAILKRNNSTITVDHWKEE